jgi:copper(I)-binding protein
LTPLKLNALVAVLLVAVAACGGAGAQPGGIAVTDAWLRVTTPDQPAGGYLTISNGSADADALTGVASPAFGTIQLHETVTMSPAAGSSGAGMMGMQPVSEIPVPGNGTVALEPGGYHMMLMEPTGSLKVGDTVELTLTFRNAGPITVAATVRGT